MAKTRISPAAQAFAICAAFIQDNRFQIHMSSHELQCLQIHLPDSSIIPTEDLLNYGCLIRDCFISAEPSLAAAKDIYVAPEYINNNIYRLLFSASSDADDFPMPVAALFVTSAREDIPFNIFTMRLAAKDFRENGDVYYTANPIKINSFESIMSKEYVSFVEQTFKDLCPYEGTRWKDYPGKETTICLPLLAALKFEMILTLDSPEKCRYFISRFVPSEKGYVAKFGKKNKSAVFTSAILQNPESKFMPAPTKLLSILPKEGKLGPSSTTLCMNFDNDWVIDAKLINSTGKVHPSAFAFTFSVSKTPAYLGEEISLDIFV